MKRSASKILKTLLVFAFVCGLTLSAATPAFANSAQTFWEGQTSGGVTIKGNGDSPIVVDSETLTFDISNEQGYGHYGTETPNTVTARYTFRNPTDSEITVRAVFPFIGEDGYYQDLSVGKFYGVTVDGVSVDSTVRATYVKDRYEFNLDAEVDNVVNEFKSAESWDLSKKVYHYKIEFRKSSAAYDSDFSEYAVLDLPTDAEFFANMPVGAYRNYNGKKSVSLFYGNDVTVADFYFVQDPVDIDALLAGTEFVRYYYHENVTSSEAGGSATLVEQNELTFKDLVYMYYDKDSSISELDWHNMIFDRYQTRATGYNLTDLDIFDIEPYYVRRWYDYKMTFGPYQTLVNEVTAPLFPDIDKGFIPTKYTYRYFLSPASTWADFKDLTIVVNTPFYILNPGDGWQKTETGYTAHYDTLPEFDTLEMTICSAENPTRKKSPYYIVIIVLIIATVITCCVVGVPILGLLIFGVIIVVKTIKSKKLRKKTLEAQTFEPENCETDFSTRPDDE